MKEKFQEYRFTQKILARIALANTILEDLARQGYSVSLRQLYYQLVQRGEIPNSQKEYKKLGDTLSKARLAGLVNWSTLEDRGRMLRGGDGGFDGVADYISRIGDDYGIEWWTGQPNYVEVWVEKDALIGVIERACSRFRVSYFSCRGYSSQSEQYKAGKRYASHTGEGRECHVIHLGDHDPSGIDMTRDNQDRLNMFSEFNVQVHRIALNMNQIEELNPPPNPAKLTDSRVGNYIALYGRHSWELDALEPSYIDRIITEKIRELVDADLMAARQQQEREERNEVQDFGRAVSDNYDDVRGWLQSQGLI